MIQLYHGNALRVLQQDIGAFDAVITDPPYASGATLADKQRGTAGKYTGTKARCPYPDFLGDQMDQRSWTRLMREVLAMARDHCTPGAVLASFIDWRNLPALYDAAQWAGWSLRGVVVWDKLSSRPQRGRFTQQSEFLVWGSNGALPLQRGVGCLPGVYRAANVQGIARVQTKRESLSVIAKQARLGNITADSLAKSVAQFKKEINRFREENKINYSLRNVDEDMAEIQPQKPLEVMREIVKICTPGGRILDPFAGSGTTLMAARAEGYSALGIEAHRGIAETAALRLGIAAESH